MEEALTYNSKQKAHALKASKLKVNKNIRAACCSALFKKVTTGEQTITHDLYDYSVVWVKTRKIVRNTLHSYINFRLLLKYQISFV